MNKFSEIYKSPIIKFIFTNLFLISLLTILFLSSNVPIFCIGFLLDCLFIIGASSLIYFIFGNDNLKNAVFTIISLFLTILFIADHIYYGNFEKFASIVSLNNLHMVMENADAYGVSLDIVAVILLLDCVLFNVFLYTNKTESLNLLDRIHFFYFSILLIIPFIATYIMAYNDFDKLDIILFPKRYKFPEFVTNYGYLIYRYEDIAVVLDSQIGG